MAKPKSAPYKTETEKDVTFAEGGDTPMFGQGDRTVTAPADAAGTQSPGRTEQHPDKGGSGKYAEGGKTKMFSYSPSVPQQAGRTGQR
jgi:hypothetical protein